jgi:hypothetical protein
MPKLPDEYIDFKPSQVRAAEAAKAKAAKAAKLTNAHVKSLNSAGNTLPRTGTRKGKGRRFKQANNLHPSHPDSRLSKGLYYAQHEKITQSEEQKISPEAKATKGNLGIGPAIEEVRNAQFTAHMIQGKGKGKWISIKPPTQNNLSLRNAEMAKNKRTKKSRTHMAKIEQAWKDKQRRKGARKKLERAEERREKLQNTKDYGNNMTRLFEEPKLEIQKSDILPNTKKPKPAKPGKPASNQSTNSAAAIISEPKLPNPAPPEPPKQPNGPIQTPRNKLNIARAQVSYLKKGKAITRSRVIELEKYEKDLRKREKKLTKKLEKYKQQGPKQKSLFGRIGYYLSGKWILKSDKTRQTEKYNQRKAELDYITKELEELEESGNAKLELKQSFNNISTRLVFAKKVSDKARKEARKEYKGTRKAAKKISQNLESEPNKSADASASSNV